MHQNALLKKELHKYQEVIRQEKEHVNATEDMVLARLVVVLKRNDRLWEALQAEMDASNSVTPKRQCT
jgi:hypothetical protein